MTDFSLTRLPLLALLALGIAGSAGCTAEGTTDEPETEISTDDITSVVQSSVKNQSIGNCWVYANLGWVVFNVNQKSQAHLTEAVQHLKRAVQEQDNCALAYQYLGAIAFTRGQSQEAKKWWQKCLEWEPNNIEASRGLRMLSTREDKDKASKSGLLGKLLKK